jgi:hypothetical protein
MHARPVDDGRRSAEEQDSSSATPVTSSVDSVDTTSTRPLPRNSERICTAAPMPNSAAPSAATCTCEIAVSAPVGITPVLRTATQARNPSTNSGTTGGRFPAVA